MRLEITRLEGQRNDLLLRMERAEIESALLSVANRDRLMSLPGMLRHRAPSAGEQQAVESAKILFEDHLQRLHVVDGAGRAQRRAVAISNRNLGTNPGHVAWQRVETPRIFHVLGDPLDYPAHSCLTVWRDGRISIEDLRFDVAAQRLQLAADGRDVGEEVEWATFGQRVLRGGRVAAFDDLAGQFYDARHLLAFDPHREPGERIRQAIYQGYPAEFAANVRRAWRAGVPRARYFHNAIGCSRDALVIVQREGTVEEAAAALREAGAEEGLVLDNGGSVACWVWWANVYRGGMIAPTIDYRPPGTSVIAFVLKGPAGTDLPGGSVSYSVV